MYRLPQSCSVLRCVRVVFATVVVMSCGLSVHAQAQDDAKPPDVRFDVHKTKHFRIHHHNAELAAKIATAAEEHLETITRAIAPPSFRRPRLKTFHIRVYRDRAEFVAHGDASSAFALAQCVSTTEVNTYEKTALGALEHEITHLVVHAYLPSMPIWIQEGFATGGYRRARPQSYKRAQRALEAGQLLPVDRLLAAHSIAEAGMPVDRYYLQSRMALEFLIFTGGGLDRFYDFGRDVRTRFEKKLTRLKRSVPRGRKVSVSTEREVEEPVREALAELYGYSDPAVFDRDFRRWIKHRAVESTQQARDRKRKFEAGFEFTTRLESEHFVLFTTSKEKLAAALLVLAEKVYETFAGAFWDTGIIMPGRMKIYLFDTREEYADFLRGLGMKLEIGKHLLPHYNVYAGAACSYRQGLSKDYLFQTVAHEVTHGLARRLNVRRSGAWLIEAIAYYVGNSVHSKTETITLGECHETKLSRLASHVRLQWRTGKLIPLAGIIEPADGALQTVGRRAQEWALFRYLETGEGGRYRRGFHAYLTELARTGRGGLEQFEKHVEPLSSFEPRFEMWASDLRATSKKR